MIKKSARRASSDDHACAHLTDNAGDSCVLRHRLPLLVREAHRGIDALHVDLILQADRHTMEGSDDPAGLCKLGIEFLRAFESRTKHDLGQDVGPGVFLSSRSGVRPHDVDGGPSGFLCGDAVDIADRD